MLETARRLIRKPITYAWAGVAALIPALIMFYLIPAREAGARLRQMGEQEQPDYCVRRADDGVTRAIAGGENAKKESDAKGRAETARDQREQDEVLACLAREQIAVASRGNMIAIEGAVGSTASTFIAYMAAIISILALLLSRAKGHDAEDVWLVPGFSPTAPGSNDGVLAVHNRGSRGVLLDAVTINGDEVLRSVSTLGLRELQAGSTVDFPVVLRDDGSGSRCFVRYRLLNGRLAEIGASFQRRGSDWQVVAVDKCY